MLGRWALSGAPICGGIGQLSGKIIPDAGVYTLGGQAAGLAVGRKITVAVGSYTLSGQIVLLPISVSQEALYRTLLVGSSASLTGGFTMITNFTMTAGDYKTLIISVKDSEGSPVNITGATFSWQCGRSFGKASTLSKTSGSGISITDGANGQLTVVLDAFDTNAMSGKYYHECQMTLSGILSTVLSGTMKVNPALIDSTATS